MPYLLLSLLAVSLSLWTAAWTWAEFITITPAKRIDRWEKLGTIDAPQTLETVRNRLQTAKSLNPTRADYDLMLGRLALLQREQDRNGQPGATGHRLPPGSDAVRFHLEQALAKRPSSGLAWTYLAKAVADDPSQSELFIKALTRSATLEPYEQLNQQKLIPLALKQWDRLPPDLKETMQTIIEHGLRYQRSAIKPLVEKSRRAAPQSSPNRNS